MYEIGTFQGSKPVGIKGGNYLLDVSADGNWNVEITTNTTFIDEELPISLSGNSQQASKSFFLWISNFCFCSWL